MYGCGKECIWFSLHLGCHRPAVSLSALNVSPLTQTLTLMWGSDPCLSSLPTKGRSSPTNTSVFPPSSFILLSFAWFYVFFSAGQVFLSALAHVLHALLCLKVYSWCICGEKCTPHPPTPLPSCSLFFTINCSIVVHVCALFLYIYLKSIKFLNFWLFMIK